MIAQTTHNTAKQLNAIKIFSESSTRATFRGIPQTVLGRRLQVGELLPAVTLVSPDLSLVDLSQFRGQIRLVSVIPSIDTGICDAQTRRFSAEAARFGNQARMITISTDMPFTQKRWLHDAQIDNITMLSDHREMAFGYAAGVYVQEMRILQRSIFVVDRDDRIVYCEYVREIGQHPDYDAALDALQKLIYSREP